MRFLNFKYSSANSKMKENDIQFQDFLYTYFWNGKNGLQTVKKLYVTFMDHGVINYSTFL